VNKIPVINYKPVKLRRVSKSEILTCKDQKALANELNQAFRVVRVENLTNKTFWRK
jgi:hypothetical protein